MPLTINVKRDATSARERVKQLGKSTYPWFCKCEDHFRGGGGAFDVSEETIQATRYKLNRRYLSKCPDCKTRREDGTRADA